MKTFVKVVLLCAVIAGLMFEVGSPLYGRSEAAGAAQDAASAAVRSYFDNTSLDAAQQAAVQAAEVRGAKVTKVELEPDGSIKVTVSRLVRSYLLIHLSTLRSWYNVTASATAPPIRS